MNKKRLVILSLGVVVQLVIAYWVALFIALGVWLPLTMRGLNVPAMFEAPNIFIWIGMGLSLAIGWRASKRYYEIKCQGETAPISSNPDPTQELIEV